VRHGPFIGTQTHTLSGAANHPVAAPFDITTSRCNLATPPCWLPLKPGRSKIDHAQPKTSLNPLPHPSTNTAPQVPLRTPRLRGTSPVPLPRYYINPWDRCRANPCTNERAIALYGVVIASTARSPLALPKIETSPAPRIQRGTNTGTTLPMSKQYYLHRDACK
jgi:hypothetical protein